jgi:phospholipid/cholesterol/gamma-HCH transport system ATP-binding protein
MTSVVVSHDVAETTQIADYAYLLSQGKVIDHGEPAALRESSSDWSQQFLKALPDGPVAFHYPAAPFIDDLMQGDRR